MAKQRAQSSQISIFEDESKETQHQTVELLQNKPSENQSLDCGNFDPSVELYTENSEPDKNRHATLKPRYILQSWINSNEKGGDFND
jgi:hypothetical protein